jgi:hypothetical protein
MVTAGLAVLAVAQAGRGLAQEVPQQPLTDHHATVEGAISTPAEDLNIKKTEFPDVLQRAVVDPYALKGASDCIGIAQEVERLDLALGADKDVPQTDDKKPTAADALKVGVEAVIPYRGLIREITGANAHAKEVQRAVEAGFARRGFLKGRALEMNCPPGASPAWYRAPELPPAPAQIALAPAPVDAAPPAEAITSTQSADDADSAIETRPLPPPPPGPETAWPAAAQPEALPPAPPPSTFAAQP